MFLTSIMTQPRFAHQPHFIVVYFVFYLWPYRYLQAHLYFSLLALLKIPAEQFKLVLDSIVWAFKHTMRNVADTGLEILYTLLRNVEKSDTSSQNFYQTYYTMILQHIFSVVTDTSHTAGKVWFTIILKSIKKIYALNT